MLYNIDVFKVIDSIFSLICDMLLTKLYIPQTGENIIHRSGLFEKLDEGLKRKLILVSATAGYGKTTLISDWVNKNKIPTAWFSIDERDNDPNEFLSFIIYGIQKTQPNIGKNSLELLNSPGTAGLDYILELFINDLLQAGHHLLLVLDDFHLVQNKQIHDLVSFLIDYKPKHFHIIISTRSDPPLPFARLRSQNELTEIRSSDLNFSKNDINELFNKKLRLSLNNKDIDLLESKTEGWIAGLRLTALTFQGQNDISAYIEQIAGDNRYIMDYLMEEILNIQSDEMRQFLLCTSILEKMTGSLCDSILGKDNSQLFLESLEKSNMFIIPLDNERKWFRYHHLFSDLLQQRLVIRYKKKIPELHNKASLWFENNKLPLFAIEHSIKAGNSQKAMNLIGGIIEQLWETSQYATILKFGSLFTEEDIIAHKHFCVIYSWALTVYGKLEIAENYLFKILGQTKDKNLLGKIYETLNLLKVFSGDVESAFKYSELATQNISEDDILWNSWANISHGESHLLRFELGECIQSLQRARENASKINNLYLNLVSESKTAYALRLKGRYNEAYKICKDLLEPFYADTTVERFRLGILSSILYSLIGFIQVEQNNVEEGIRNAQKGYELSQKATSISFKGYSALLYAEAYYKSGDYYKALQVIEDLESILNKKVAQWLYVLAYSLKSKLYILTGDLDKLDFLFKQKISSDKNHAFETYFYNVSIARYKLEQRRYEEVFELLQKLSAGLENDHANELLTEVELLKAKAFYRRNKQNDAIKSVLKAIRLTQNEELIRTYINEGEEIEVILKEIKKEKDTKSTELLNSINDGYLQDLLEAFLKERKTQKIISEKLLSDRELDTLKLIAKNLSNQEVANELYISITTVKTHVRNILLKLEAKNRNEAVVKAKEKGIL